MDNRNNSVREISYGEAAGQAVGDIYSEPMRRTGKNNKQNNGTQILIYVLVVVLWAGLLLAGIFMAHKYMESAKEDFLMEIQAVRDENQGHTNKLLLQIDELNNHMGLTKEELENVLGQLELINEELELTGESISGSDESKQALATRISDLDKQLLELRNQLKKLEEAARVY